jgi:hypothetical protein
MTPIKIYIDPNYPPSVVKILQDIHALHKEKIVIILTWNEGNISEEDRVNGVFMVMDFQKRGFSIPILKQAQDGYKTIVCKGGEKMERFELMMTILGVWPKILKEIDDTNEKILLSFKYGRRNLVHYDLQELVSH